MLSNANPRPYNKNILRFQVRIVKSWGERFVGDPVILKLGFSLELHLLRVHEEININVQVF